MENGSFAATYDGTQQALIVTGELDEETSLSLRDAIETHTESYSRALAVDLSAVDYLPSAAVGVLAQALQKSTGAEQPLELVAADGTIAQRVLQVCALPHRAS